MYEQAGAIAARSCSPMTDARGSAEYKRHLAAELTKRALRRSVARIRETQPEGISKARPDSGRG
jgi:carbon-monoxide dehydrogenase medium subunit